jgi:hypothetical protein
MTDEDKRRRLKKDIEFTEDQLKKAEAEKKQREERRLHLEEELRTKSKILKRPLIEDIKRKTPQKPKEKDAADEEDAKSAGKTGKETRVDSYMPGSRPARGPQGGCIDGADRTGGGGGPAISDDSTGQADYGGVSDDADGGSRATGVGQRRTKPFILKSLTVGSLMKEAVLRHWDAELKARGERDGVTPGDLGRRIWIRSGVRGDGGIKAIENERQLNDLKVIETEASMRLGRIKTLNGRKAAGNITADEDQTLRNLEDEEAKRYYLRDRFIRKMPLEEQKKLDWLQPIDDGAMGVMPYTFITAFDLMTPGAKRAMRWTADNQLLRWQNAIVSQFLPKKPSLSWFKAKAKKGIETLFDDMNEEIYSDKKWAELVKTSQAKLDDMEEELSGYDRFTVDEEQKIAKMFADYMAKMTAEAKEEQYYG